MKILKLFFSGAIVFSAAVLFPASAFAQCAETALEKTGKLLATKTFEVKESSGNKSFAGETLLSLEASTEGASWATKGAEGAVVTIFADGKYNQDVMLFAGTVKFTYRVALGRFEKGRHTLTAVLNEAHSAMNAKKVKIHSLDVSPVNQNARSANEDLIAAVNSPILYARPNAVDKFTDIPLITYYEVLPVAADHFKIRYTTIFANEDGGTQTTALMARWGRATDIEWVYEIELRGGKIASEIYQGANHETLEFRGKRGLGNHPLIYVATENNNFSDAGCSALRVALAPVRADLSERSRETVMDENPWTYRIMAEELVREGRVNPRKLGANTIDDLRNYVFVEIYSRNDSAAVALEVQTIDEKTSRSDFGDERLRIDRSGYQRIAVRLPSTDAPLKSLNLICQSVNAERDLGICRDARIIKLIRLDKDYRLFSKIKPNDQSRSLKSGETLTWTLAAQ